MKLPDIKFVTPVQRAGARSPYLPLAKAGVSVAKAGAVAAGAAATHRIAQTIYNRQVEMDIEKSQMLMLTRSTEIYAEHANKTSYSADEVDEDLQKYGKGEKGFGEGKSIDGYEVRPELIKRREIEAMEEAATGIRDTDAARNFKVHTGKVIESRYQRGILSAQIEQKQVRYTRQEAMIAEFRDSGRYAAARAIVGNIEGHEARKATLKIQIDKQEEIDPISLSITQTDVPMMKEHLKIMQQSPEEYKKSGGELLQPERMAWAARLERAIWMAGKADREALAADKRLAIDDARKITAANYKSYDVSSDRERESMLKMIAYDEPVIAREMQASILFQEQAAKIALMPQSERRRLLDSTREGMAGNERSALLHGRFEKAVDEMWRDQQEDSASFANKVGLTQPIKLDKKNLIPVLKAMNINDETVRGTYGTSTGLFTKSQSVEFANDISTQQPSELMKTFGQMRIALDDDVNKVHEQLKADGLADTLPVAGQVFQSGDEVSAFKLVEGRRLHQNYPKVLKGIDDLDEEINQMLGGAYRNQKGQHELMMEAVKDAYVGELFKPGQEVEANPDSIDDAKLQNAYLIATGGLIEVNGGIIEPAYRGQTQEQFQDRLDRMTVSDLSKLGVPINFQGSELLEDMADEKVDYVNAGQNEYYMFHIPSNEYIRDARTGGAYIYRYNFKSPAVEGEPPPRATTVPGWELDPSVIGSNKPVRFTEKEAEAARMKGRQERMDKSVESFKGTAKSVLKFLGETYKSSQKAFDKFQEKTTLTIE